MAKVSRSRVHPVYRPVGFTMATVSALRRPGGDDGTARMYLLDVETGELNASHTGVSGGPDALPGMPRTQQTRFPGFELEAHPSGLFTVGHIYRNGPADRDHLRIQSGHYVLSVNGNDLKTGENYLRQFTLASNAKFHVVLNDRPSPDGAWTVTIEPAGNMADLRFHRRRHRAGSAGNPVGPAVPVHDRA